MIPSEKFELNDLSENMFFLRLVNFVIKTTFIKIVVSEIFDLDVINMRHLKKDLNHNICIFLNDCG